MPNTYLITGANRGIGLAMSKIVLSEGNRLIAVCRDATSAIELKNLIATSKGRGELFEADVNNPAALDAVSKKIEYPIDILVCNAGISGARGGIQDEQNNAQIAEKILVTNIGGPLFTVRAFLKQVKNSSQPKIAIISSLMGSQQHTGNASYLYRASKAGVNNIMVTMAHELKTDGIAVASYHPGWVRTDMGGSAADISPQESAAGLIARFKELSISSTGSFINYDGNSIPL